MSQDRLWELISLKLSGEANSAELQELEQLLQANHSAGYKLELLETIWNSRNEQQAVNRKDAFDRHMQRLSNHLSEPVLQYETDADDEQFETSRKPGGIYRKLGWVTSIAAALVIGFFLFTNYSHNSSSRSLKSNALNTVSTKKASKSKVQLPDGTEVWLNADSRIAYRENFQGQFREVELTGEAFFDVVRDETRPFIIHTGTIDVKVLGTAFNVRSYANEKNTETSLIRGSVEITLIKSPDKRKIILKPNDKLIVNNRDASVSQSSRKEQSPVFSLARINYKPKDSSAVEILWVDNKLAFDREPLEDIALKLERWYDVKVTILDEKLKAEPYTATFEDKTLQEVMAALQASGNFHYSVANKEVVIRP